MRITVIVIGVLLALTGLIWLGQGIGLIKGSVMTGQALWAGIGAACLVAGAVLAAIAWRRPARH